MERKRIGALCEGGRRCEFMVWAPFPRKVSLKTAYPHNRTVAMKRDDLGYWRLIMKDVEPGTRYFYLLETEKGEVIERPDPASRSQPEGVHGPSEVIDHASFSWEDKNWKGIAPWEMIIYEMHVGTFTDEGTFDAVIPRLTDLKELGINAVEIMPVAQFPGKRNWGYDGACLFAAQDSYGGTEGLKRLVCACHKIGMALILDVVYNHLGPEGNYLGAYGPYFTDRYKTPWGDALNFDGPYSNEVRNFFIENALSWLEDYHIDALRIDAIHGIFDMSARHFLTQLSERVESFSRAQGRRFYLIAESDLNNPATVRTRDEGGHGFHAQWCDDFHHSLHTLLTGEKEGYYADFGEISHMVKSLKEGFVYSGQYSTFRKRNHGASSADIPPERFVAFSQCHDQVGNRARGERLSSIISFEALKLAAGMVLLSPYIPMLFMGEEYSETAPFLYFVSHTDSRLTEGVRKGRQKEFGAFRWIAEPPDPASEETYHMSKLDWNLRKEGNHVLILDLYRELIRLRRKAPALSFPDRASMDVKGSEERRLVLMERRRNDSRMLSIFNFNSKETEVSLPPANRRWKTVLNSADDRWGGPGVLLPGSMEGGESITIRGKSFALYEMR